MEAIFPTPDPSLLKHDRMIDLVQYARKVEGDMFDSANSLVSNWNSLIIKVYVFYLCLFQLFVKIRSRHVFNQVDTALYVLMFFVGRVLSSFGGKNLQDTERAWREEDEAIAGGEQYTPPVLAWILPERACRFTNGSQFSCNTAICQQWYVLMHQ